LFALRAPFFLGLFTRKTGSCYRASGTIRQPEQAARTVQITPAGPLSWKERRVGPILCGLRPLKLESGFLHDPIYMKTKYLCVPTPLSLVLSLQRGNTLCRPNEMQACDRQYTQRSAPHSMMDGIVPVSFYARNSLR
jgi:hypothetical protein